MSDDVGSLLRRWALAWAVARGAVVEGRAPGGVLVRLRGAAARDEVVAQALSDEALAWVAGRSDRLLTVVAPVSVAGLPAGVVVDRDDEVLMRVERGTSGRPWPPGPLGPQGLEVDVDEHDDRLTLRLVAEGRVVSEGTVALRGTGAAYDRIETLPSHRRRGLGRWVVSTLHGWASAHGATTGLLVATPEGRSLYAGLGWTAVARLVSLRGSS